MIFQQDFNTPHIFSPIPMTTPQPFSPKTTTILSREERMRLRKQERRRRKLQEIKSGIKRFIAMLFSHIGLSGLVIAYTIVGGLLFGGIERGKEKEVKTLAYEYRIDSSNEFLQLVFGELHSYLAKQRQTYNDTIAFLEFVIDFLEKEKPKKKTYSVENITDNLDYRDINHENNTEILNTTDLINRSTFNNFENINLNTSMKTNYFNNLSKLNTPKNSVGLYYKNVTNTVNELELDNIRGEYSLKAQFVLLLRGRVQIALMEFTKRVVDFIETDGWNGNDSMEDLKWSFAGSVLYAITVITTIGYGHATPKTNLGKFMTIIYALIGIPLMFLYLSNIGDYLADIFRVIYSRTCRTSCERFCSASIFNNHNNNKQIEQMNKFINNNSLQQNEPVDNDPIVNPTHSHGRRRKRILLPPFNTKMNDYDTSMNNNNNNNNNNNYNHINNKVNCTNKKTKNDSVNLNEIDNKTNVTMEATTTTTTSSFNNKKIKLFHYLKNKQFFIKFLTYSQKSCAFIKKSCMLPLDRSNNTIALTQKAKNYLHELFHPPFSWLQKMMRTIICKNQFKSSPVSMNDNTDNKYINYPNIFFQNIHQGSEFDLMHNNPISTINSNTINNISHQTTTLNNQIDILSCRTTALVESNNFNDNNPSTHYYDSKQLYEQLTKKNILSNQTMKYKHYSTLPLVTNSLNNTFNSSGYIFTSPKCISTVETLPIFNQSNLYHLQNDSTKYFTYDGQHRKFYLMARYLRSAQRQRRHKRRVQKRLQEQERSEKKRLENEKLYGTLFSHQSNQIIDDKRQNIHKIKSLTNISDDKASTGSTILSGSGMEDFSDGRIRLLCWKDIDIDLEVRSIDENYDDIHGLKNIENTKDWSTKATVDGATVIVNMNVSEPISHMNKKRSIKCSMSKIRCNHNCCKTHNSKSYISLQQSTQNNLSLVHTMTEPKNETPKYCTMHNTILSSYPQTPFEVACPSSKPFHKLLTHSISTSDKEKLYDVKPLSNSIRPNPAAIHMSYHQIPMNKLNVSKSGLSSLPIHNSLQQKQTSQIPTTSASRANIPPKLNQNLSFFPTVTLPNSFHYSQPNQCSTMSFLPESHSLQPDSFQRLLQSTVISNPFATCEDVSRDIKPEQLGRSRLSLASSRGDLDSEIVVQLSYYSQRGSKQSEDLSFFSYRDGFSAEEDVSKVTVPISLSLVIMTTYILIGAIVFSIWQDPDYLKWSYFCFITLSTIGFGDIVPGKFD
ncbi:unnamed protein product [Schistosoma bovis]|nr:unnamed protein product [Schistosoma bovis]